MTALSSLLMTRPGDDYLQAAWVAAVLPLASDPEQTCQVRFAFRVEAAVEAVEPVKTFPFFFFFFFSTV